MDVSKNRDIPKWMVYNGKPYEQMDDLGVPLPIFGNTFIGLFQLDDDSKSWQPLRNPYVPPGLSSR